MPFFDEKSKAEEQVFLAFNSKTKKHCPLTNRGQDYGQWTNIWRLGLITKAKGGADYQGRIISLEKRLIGKNWAYVIVVTDPGSDEHKDWIAKSAHVGKTSGTAGRQFGYY